MEEVKSAEATAETKASSFSIHIGSQDIGDGKYAVLLETRFPDTDFAAQALVKTLLEPKSLELFSVLSYATLEALYAGGRENALRLITETFDELDKEQQDDTNTVSPE